MEIEERSAETQYSQTLMRLRIAGLELYAYHGAFAEERVLGGKYAVDAELEYNAHEAVADDNLLYALNYRSVVERIASIMEERPYKLIETVVGVILDRHMKEFPHLERMTVRLRKYNVPLGRTVGYVEAEQTAERPALRSDKK